MVGPFVNPPPPSPKRSITLFAPLFITATSVHRD